MQHGYVVAGHHVRVNADPLDTGLVQMRCLNCKISDDDVLSCCEEAPFVREGGATTDNPRVANLNLKNRMLVTGGPLCPHRIAGTSTGGRFDREGVRDQRGV